MRTDGEAPAGAPASIVGLVWGLAMALGCAHQAAKGATSGAIESMTEKSQAETGERPAELIAGRAVEGALAHLNYPQQIAMLRQAVAQASLQAGQSLTTGVAQELNAELGSAGAGPLGTSITAVTDQAAAAGARGVLRILAPACTGEDSTCVDRRIADLSRQAGTGFMAGVRKQLEVPALLLAFLAGAGCAVAVTLVVRRWSRPPHRSRLPASGAPSPHPQPT
jgi:hypothetical protein